MSVFGRFLSPTGVTFTLLAVVGSVLAPFLCLGGISSDVFNLCWGPQQINKGIGKTVEEKA